MQSQHARLIASIADLEEPIAPSTSGDRVVPGVIVGLIVMVFI